MSDVDPRFAALCEQSVKDAKRIAELEAIVASQTAILERIVEAAGYVTGQTYSADGIINRLRKQGAT